MLFGLHWKNERLSLLKLKKSQTTTFIWKRGKNI